MEKFQEAREKAIKNLKTADHMLNVTYPIVNDAKLLLTIIDNVFLALTNSVSAILHYEALYKRMPVFEDKFEAKFNMLKKHADRLKIDRSFMSFILDVKSIIVEHKKSPVEFRRGGRLVICSDNYNMQVLSQAQIANFISKARDFVWHMDRIVSGKWKSL